MNPWEGDSFRQDHRARIGKRLGSCHTSTDPLDPERRVQSVADGWGLDQGRGAGWRPWWLRVTRQGPMEIVFLAGGPWTCSASRGCSDGKRFGFSFGDSERDD